MWTNFSGLILGEIIGIYLTLKKGQIVLQTNGTVSHPLWLHRRLLWHPSSPVSGVVRFLLSYKVGANESHGLFFSSLMMNDAEPFPCSSWSVIYHFVKVNIYFLNFFIIESITDVPLLFPMEPLTIPSRPSPHYCQFHGA